MKIRMTTSMAGTDYTLNAGDETDRFGDEEAMRIVEAGFAVIVEATKKRTAMKKNAAKEVRG